MYEPVGHLTGCTMKVIPKRAIMTVTTADSKYSRMGLRGGPLVSVSSCGSGSRPLGLTARGLNTPAFSVGLSSVVMADSFIADIVDVGKRRGQASRRFGLNRLPFASKLPAQLRLRPL